MSYYILPKTNFDFDFDYNFSLIVEDTIKQNISFSLHNYLNIINNQIQQITKTIYSNNSNYNQYNDDNSIHFLYKVINPYEFIYTNVPGSKLSVSKLKPHSNSFYILMEIVFIFNLLDNFENKNIITMSYGENAQAITECLTMLREEKEDVNINSIIDISYIRKYGCDLYSSNLSNVFRHFTYDFLYYELHEDDYKSTNNYITGLIYILCNLLCHQSNDGIAIIKIDNIFYKPIIDILYILTSIYDNIYIIKPNITNALTNERYIICKKFIYNSYKSKHYYAYFMNLNILLKNSKSTEIIGSLIKKEIPYYFITKIEEANIIIGHQQMEYMDQLLNLHNNKNKDDKITVLKKNNIQKCIQWCEKFKIPYNKFTDKVNIFLNDEKSSNEENIFLPSKNNINNESNEYVESIESIESIESNENVIVVIIKNMINEVIDILSN